MDLDVFRFWIQAADIAPKPPRGPVDYLMEVISTRQTLQIFWWLNQKNTLFCSDSTLLEQNQHQGWNFCFSGSDPRIHSFFRLPKRVNHDIICIATKVWKLQIYPVLPKQGQYSENKGDKTR